MFFKEFLKNKLNVIILIGSVLSLIPLIVLVHNALDLLRTANIGVENEKFIKDVLSRTIMYWPNISALAIGLVVWTINSVISAWAIHTKKIRPVFAYTSLLFGGLAIHLFVVLGYWIGSKTKLSDKKIKIRASVITISTLVFAIIPVAAFSLAISKKSFDDPFVGKKVEISFDEKNPNMIEIFSDGFDKRFSEEIENDQTLKDFYIFDKFQTEGVLTHITVPTLYDGFSRNNPFSIALNKGITNSREYVDYVYGGHWLETGIEHLSDKNFPYFGQRTVINPITLSSNGVYGATSSGTPESIMKMDPQLNVTNWSGARDENSGKWGISNYSPDMNSMEWLNRNLTTANNGQKGARVFIPNLITHRPFMNNSSGNFSTENISYEQNKKALFGSFEKLVSVLKSMKNPNAKHLADGSIDPNEKIKNAYDNTLIIIYGDHASHEEIFDEKNNGVYDDLASRVRKTESLMMIKYPQVENPTNRIKSNRYVYSGQLNSIITDYYSNNIGNKMAINYFDNSKFDNVPRPAFIHEHEYIMANWSDTDNKLVVSKDQSGNAYKPVFLSSDKSTLKSQVDELLDKNKVVYYE